MYRFQGLDSLMTAKGITDSGTYPLGGIILLSRDVTDHVEELSPEERILSVSKRLISPAWTEALFQKNLCLTKEIVSETMVCRLFCTKEPTAAHVMKRYLDEKLQ